MALFDKDIYNTEIPVCEKHNFRGIICLQCIYEGNISKDIIKTLIKDFTKRREYYHKNAVMYFTKSNDQKFNRNLGARNAYDKIIFKLNQLL